MNDVSRRVETGGRETVFLLANGLNYKVSHLKFLTRIINQSMLFVSNVDTIDFCDGSTSSIRLVAV
jgi:hypothetical protein